MSFKHDRISIGLHRFFPSTIFFQMISEFRCQPFVCLFFCIAQTIIVGVGFGTDWQDCPGFNAYYGTNLFAIVPTIFSSCIWLGPRHQSENCSPALHIMTLCLQLCMLTVYLTLTVVQPIKCQTAVVNKNGWLWLLLGVCQLLHVYIAAVIGCRFIRCTIQHDED